MTTTTRAATTFLLFSIATGSLAGADADFTVLNGKAWTRTTGMLHDTQSGEHFVLDDAWSVDSGIDPASYAAFEAIETREYNVDTALANGSTLLFETVLRIDESPNGFWIIPVTASLANLEPMTTLDLNAETYVEVQFKVSEPMIVELGLQASTNRWNGPEGPHASIWLWDDMASDYAAKLTRDGAQAERLRDDRRILIQPGYYEFGGYAMIAWDGLEGPTVDATSGNGNSFIHLEEWTPGDVDLDGDVDGADLAGFLAAWGTQEEAADANGDGTVDGTDLGLLLGNWG